LPSKKFPEFVFAMMARGKLIHFLGLSQINQKNEIPPLCWQALSNWERLV
jgi:hypothetical protein